MSPDPTQKILMSCYLFYYSQNNPDTCSTIYFSDRFFTPVRWVRHSNWTPLSITWLTIILWCIVLKIMWEIQPFTYFFFKLLTICFCIRHRFCVVECIVIRKMNICHIKVNTFHLIFKVLYKKNWLILPITTMKLPWEEAMIKLSKWLLLNAKWAIFQLYHV